VSGGSLWSPSFSGGEPIVSYSQNAEDVRLWRVFRTIENGFYVDVGAADPYVDSVTHLFYEHGWSGINLEPTPCFEAISEARKRDVNLRIAIGESEDSVPFFLTYPYLGLSSFDPSVHAHVPEAIERIEEIAIPQRRLESVLREHAADRTIHFLKIDVEGAEAEVLASSDWASFRPIVVIAEAIESWSTSPTHETWENVLLDAGYQFAAFDGINRFYVDESHEHLIPILAYPISALDRFVTASMRDLEVELEQTLARLHAKATEAESLRRSVDDVYRSRIWRASRIIANAARPVRSAGGRLRKLSLR
jgi:FkbM family methyltransferase